MEDIDTSEINEIARPEQLQLLFEEIRNLQMQMNDLKEDVEIIMDNQDKTQNLVKGGSQPKKQIKVVHENGGPGSVPVREIMHQARKGPKYNGVTSKQAEKILEENNSERSRQTVLNILGRIADEFPKYEVKKGSANEATALYYNSQGGQK